MPSKKIIVVSIFCLGVILSTWLLFRNKKDAQVAMTQKESSVEATVSARPYIEASSTEGWKKMLTKVSPANQVYTDLTKKPVNSPETFDDTTVTAQVAKDFLSQYLLAKQGGKDLTATEISQIAQNVSAVPQYTKNTGAIYIPTNLHVTAKTDSATLRKYKDTVNYSLKKWSTQIQNDPRAILSKAIQTQDEKELAKMDPLIAITKGLVTDFLNMEVPQAAINEHLGLLNSFSNALSDLQALRNIFNDPIRAVSAIGQLNTHLSNFTISLANLNVVIAKY